MHVAVSEFARHVAGMDGANSTEMDPETPYPVIDLLPEQKEIADMGGTMRLGADPVKLHDDTLVRRTYDEPVVYERHRHRYEVNNHLRRRLESLGLVCSGTSPDERLVEVIELESRPPPVLRGLAVPPGVQVAPRAARAAVPCVRRCRPGPCRRRTGCRGRRECRRGFAAGLADQQDVRRATDAQRARLHETFVALCRIESPSGHERGCAEWLGAELRSIGLEVEEDRGYAGSDAGNLLARIPGGSERSMMLCAHMDTVPLAAPIEPVLVDGGWENAGDGILGADNKAAIAVLLELARGVHGGRPAVR